jgi:hypothetical protein
MGILVIVALVFICFPSLFWLMLTLTKRSNLYVEDDSYLGVGRYKSFLCERGKKIISDKTCDSFLSDTRSYCIVGFRTVSFILNKRFYVYVNCWTSALLQWI